MKRIGVLASAIAVTAALAVLAAFWAGVGRPAQHMVRIALVGTQPQETDRSLIKYREALLRQAAAQAPGTAFRLEYHQGSGTDMAVVRHAIEAAMATNPAALVVPTADSAQVAASISVRPPIVFATHDNPVAQGVVDSLGRPGRRTTGVSLFDDLHLKRLELLKDAFPRVRKVAILADSPWLAAWSGDALAAQAKARLGLATIVHVADSPDALDRLMNSSAAAHVDAWYIPPTYIAWLAQPALIAHLQRLRLPAIHATDDEVKAGALMAYSWDKDFAYDAMATLTLRIAAGEDAGSIPVERPRRYLLSIRIRAQDADGEPWARIAPAMVRRADRLY